MRYHVIEHYQLSKFIDMVNSAIEQGWIPQGGVSKVVSPGGSETWSQAMVMEKKVSE